jgi:hypothetical protein
MFVPQFQSRRSFMERLVTDAVSCGVGPLAGMDADETYEVLQHINTLPSGRRAVASPAGVDTNKGLSPIFAYSHLKYIFSVS